MKLTSKSFENNGTIPEAFAFAKKDPVNHFALSGNKNPHLSWSDVPDGAKSFVLVCHDPDVPSKPDDVNQKGRSYVSAPKGQPQEDLQFSEMSSLENLRKN